jgi:hypothetical protein
MENIYYLLLFTLICWYLFYLRKVAEVGKIQAQKYCEQTSTQFISVARRSSKPCFEKKYGFHWFSTFDFEFSGDGETAYEGVLTLRGLKLEQVVIPPYKVH